MPDPVPERLPDPVLYDVRDGVATVTLNRPDTRNALTTEVKEALRDAVRTAADDPAVRAVVLTGAGPAFCVGQDLKEHVHALQADPTGVWRTVPEHYNPVTAALAGMPKPVVAAVNGVAAGAGAAFAFACDLRVLARSAGFNLAYTGIGLTADAGASWTLPRLVGWARATELLLLPRTVAADEALQLGLATRVVDDGTALDAAQELAGRLAAGPTQAYAAVRRSLGYAATATLAQALAFEAEQQQQAGTTADHLAATQAFVAKQRPVFTGR